MNTLEALTSTPMAKISTSGHPLTLQITVRLVSSETFRVRSKSGIGYLGKANAARNQHNS